jgi:hypothetical protein
VGQIELLGDVAVVFGFRSSVLNAKFIDGYFEFTSLRPFAEKGRKAFDLIRFI